MPELDMVDLSNVAKIKSKVMNVYCQLSTENGCTKSEAAKDIFCIIEDLINLENALQSKVM